MNLEQAFNKALHSSENRYADGTVNWNFVDADCAMDMAPGILAGLDCDAFYDEFDQLAAKYEKNSFPETAVGNWITLKEVLQLKQRRVLSQV